MALKSKAKTILPIAVTLLGIFIIVFGGLSKNLDVMSLGTIIIWIGNMIFCVEDFQKRFFFFLFQCTFFTFLLGRIVVSYLIGEKWWMELGQTYENNCFAVTAIAVSLISILIGSIITEIFWNRRKKRNFEYNKNKIEFRANLQAVALIVVAALIFNQGSHLSALGCLNALTHAWLLLSDDAFHRNPQGGSNLACGRRGTCFPTPHSRNGNAGHA